MVMPEEVKPRLHLSQNLVHRRLARIDSARSGPSTDNVGPWRFVRQEQIDPTKRLAGVHLFAHEMPAAVGQFDGSITTLKPYAAAADGTPNPTWRCIFPEAPPDGLLPTCAQAGILGALTGVLGSMQALEVIKEIVGIGEGLVGRLLLYDARGARFETIEYRWNPANPLNGVAAAAE